MRRWISPVDATGRYSNGWWPRIVWPHVVYGNVGVTPPHAAVDLRTLTPVDLDRLDPAIRDALTATPRGPGVPVPHAPIIVDGAPWVWEEIGTGPNEQVFAVGHVVGASDGLGHHLEMPGLDLHAHFDADTRTWTVVGQAMGNHGTPDYRDGELHIAQFAHDQPLTRLADHVTRFQFPVRLPEVVTAAVWTFGDVVTGTIGGGEHPTRPNRQGIGLYADDCPWLDRNKPVLGVWTSPYDAVHNLRAYSEDRIRTLVTAYRVPEVMETVVRLYAEERARGGWNMDAIEETIAVAVCRQTGGSLTMYDDHVLQEVPGSEGTRYRPELLARMYGLHAMGIGVVCGMRFYPDGQAGWSLRESAQAIIRGDGPWLGLSTEVTPMPVAYTLGLYTQMGHWAPTGVAARLEEAVREGVGVGVVCFDVFGVGRGGESDEWNAWSDAWLSALLSRAQGDTGRWPRTRIPAVPAPSPAPEPPLVSPPVPPSTPPSAPRKRLKTNRKIAAGVGGGALLFALLKALFG